ncbi:Transcriptional repressor XBP1 [Ceratocystis lukuohia]|uniref:Transcriptional repressor XBP1 n=1 Tax=Ceratocystis lukuohia TaxID=2019550 RepID=A0ABR4M8G1_9PEZI
MLSWSSILNPAEPKSTEDKELIARSSGAIASKASANTPLLSSSCSSAPELSSIRTPLNSSSRTTTPSDALYKSDRPMSAHSSHPGSNAHYQSLQNAQQRGYMSSYSLSPTYLHQSQGQDPYIPALSMPNSAMASSLDSRAMHNSIPVRVLPPAPLNANTSSRDPPFTKSPISGSVNYPPFEDLSVQMTKYVLRYQVNPFGNILDNSSHIPYNSGKKDFFEKTGRESFEAPGEDSEFNVMWDYNNGLVRMTPFFKCCRYGKTIPAKMLNQNPGLKDITHSITGGTILAQGYWMPYECAKAICATFCHPIAGALVPLFGPDFPQECVSPDSPEFGHMVIHPEIIVRAAHQAEAFRQQYILTASSRRRSPTANSLSPKRGRKAAARITPDSPYFNRGHDSPHTTDTEEDGLASPAVGYAPRIAIPRGGAFSNVYSPYTPTLSKAPTSNGWTAINSTYSYSDRDAHQSPVAISREGSCEPGPLFLDRPPRLRPHSVSPPHRDMSLCATSNMSSPSSLSHHTYQLPNPGLPPLANGKRRIESEHAASVVRYDRFYRGICSDPSAYKYSKSSRMKSPTSSPPSHRPTPSRLQDRDEASISQRNNSGRPLETSDKKAAAILLMGLSGQEEGDEPGRRNVPLKSANAAIQ